METANDGVGSGAEVRAEDPRLAALRAGDERVFSDLIARHHSAMLRVARAHVPSREVAEEVVQETWLAVIEGIARFEGRSSLETWIFRILTNRSITRGVRERRTVPFSALAAADAEADDPAVDADRFRGSGEDVAGGHWSMAPRPFPGGPERALAKEVRDLVAGVVASLPVAQRTVISLRDIEGWSSSEVCDRLTISEGNQRVLLHRARSKVRRALEGYYDGD